MHCTDGVISGVKRMVLAVHADARGHFVESFQTARYSTLLKQAFVPLQHNVSLSKKSVLRGLHYQRNYPQAKLLRVLNGKIMDVVVDVRRDSPTYRQHAVYKLYGPEFAETEAHEQLWLPAGVAHGFYVLSDEAIVEYSCDAVYQPGDEYSLRWDDPDLAIAWPSHTPLLSEKDRTAMSLSELEQAGLLPVLSVKQP